MPPFAESAIFAADGTPVVAGVPIRLDSGGNVSLVDPNADDEARIKVEFGAFDHHEKTFAAAVDNRVQARDLANQENINGMLFWTYDCQEQERLYHATDDWELFYRKMGNFAPTK